MTLNITLIYKDALTSDILTGATINLTRGAFEETFTNISERKKAEDELRNRENDLHIRNELSNIFLTFSTAFSKNLSYSFSNKSKFSSSMFSICLNTFKEV